MNKTHKIKNFTDLFKVTTLENYDRFTADFLIMFYNIIKAKETMTKDEIKSVKIPYFEWIDDNLQRTGYKFEDNELIFGDKKK